MRPLRPWLLLSALFLTVLGAVMVWCLRGLVVEAPRPLGWKAMAAVGGLAYLTASCVRDTLDAWREWWTRE